jgi:hypothetical protein
VLGDGESVKCSGIGRWEVSYYVGLEFNRWIEIRNCVLPDISREMRRVGLTMQRCHDGTPELKCTGGNQRGRIKAEFNTHSHADRDSVCSVHESPQTKLIQLFDHCSFPSLPRVVGVTNEDSAFARCEQNITLDKVTSLQMTTYEVSKVTESG